MFDGHWVSRMENALDKANSTSNLELRRIYLDLANHYERLSVIVMPANFVAATRWAE